MNQLRLAAILPHLEVFGGVRRYLMLARLWASWGHDVTLWTVDGRAPSWLSTTARVRRLGDTPDAEPYDAAFTPQPALLDALRSLPAARRVWYCVLEGERGENRALADGGITLMANSGALRARLMRRSRRPVLDGIGGIDPERFRPDATARVAGRLTVLAYGRRSRPKKGTDLIVRAFERVAPRFPGSELVLFDHVGPGNEQDPRAGFASRAPVRWVLNPSQDELARLYASADVFVAAERKAGWCNTAIEAMSSGAAVVCTPSGTRDFARHGETAWVVPVRHPWFLARGLGRVLADDALRARLSAAGPGAVRPFAWPVLAAKILDQLGLGAAVPRGAAG
jgi:glycosyltransferase involved in cell wall biosynthesis